MHIYIIYTQQDRITNTSILTRSMNNIEKHVCKCYNCQNESNMRHKICLQPYHKTWFERNVFVSKSPVHGYGLFACKDLQPNDIICFYSGKRVSAQKDSAFVCKVNGDEEHGGTDSFIDGSNHANFSGRWINHSYIPNARLIVPIGGVLRCHENRRDVIIVECVKEIKKGEEIFINYGWKYFMQEKSLNTDYFYTKESPTWKTMLEFQLQMQIKMNPRK